MGAANVACGYCAQQPGEPCLDMPAGQFHAERYQAATMVNSLRPGEPPTQLDFDFAVIQRLGF